MSKTYKVDGMTCGGCAASVQKAIVAAVPGAVVSIDLPTARVTVEAGAVEDTAVRKAVEDAGFDFAGTV